MLKLKKGNTVPFPEKLGEGFEVRGDSIVANVDADKIGPLVEAFIRSHRSVFNFRLELVTTEMLTDWQGTRPGYSYREIYSLILARAADIAEELGEDVGSAFPDPMEFFRTNGGMLVEDGTSTFSFTAEDDTITCEPFNVVTLTGNLVALRALLQEAGIPQVEHLVTAPETFTEKEKGEKRVSSPVWFESVYTIPKHYKEMMFEGKFRI